MIIRKLVTCHAPDLICDSPRSDIDSFLSTPIILKSGQNTPRLTDHGDDFGISGSEGPVRRPKTSHSRVVTIPRNYRMDLPGQAMRVFEAATERYSEERRMKHDIINRYENRMTKFEVETFRKRYSGQRRIEIRRKTRDKGVLESIVKQRQTRVIPIFSS